MSLDGHPGTMSLDGSLEDGGKRYLPADVRTDRKLVDERRSRNGVVQLRYRAG